MMPCKINDRQKRSAEYGAPEAIACVVADLVGSKDYFNGWVAAPGNGFFFARKVIDGFEYETNDR